MPCRTPRIFSTDHRIPTVLHGYPDTRTSDILRTGNGTEEKGKRKNERNQAYFSGFNSPRHEASFPALHYTPAILPWRLQYCQCALHPGRGSLNGHPLCRIAWCVLGSLWLATLCADRHVGVYHAQRLSPIARGHARLANLTVLCLMYPYLAYMLKLTLFFANPGFPCQSMSTDPHYNICPIINSQKEKAAATQWSSCLTGGENRRATVVAE
jgi:hypothetical protein